MFRGGRGNQGPLLQFLDQLVALRAGDALIEGRCEGELCAPLIRTRDERCNESAPAVRVLDVERVSVTCDATFGDRDGTLAMGAGPVEILHTGFSDRQQLLYDIPVYRALQVEYTILLD